MSTLGQSQPDPEGNRRRLKSTSSAQALQRPGKKSRVAADAPVTREQRIAEAAYFRAETRNFEAGRELDDWLAAELEIDSPSERDV